MWLGVAVQSDCNMMLHQCVPLVSLTTPIEFSEQEKLKSVENEFSQAASHIKTIENVWVWWAASVQNEEFSGSTFSKSLLKRALCLPEAARLTCLLHILFPARTNTEEPFHEICSPCSFFHNLLGIVSCERIRSLWRRENPAQWNLHRLPKTDLQSENYTILLDRNAHHEVGPR